MAYAPHTNTDVHYQLIHGIVGKLPIVFGQFRLKDEVLENTFEYAERRHPDDNFAPEFPHIVYVGPNGEETRLAKVLKTVAYVVVDEDDLGPVIEKWQIKQHKIYDTQWVGRK